MICSYYFTFVKLDNGGIEDRAYRLAYNMPNVRVDSRALATSAFCGVAYPFADAFWLKHNRSIVCNVFRGAAVGYVAGTMIAIGWEVLLKK
jgi:hypothetical protein